MKTITFLVKGDFMSPCNKKFQVYRNVCPRNCYNNCGMKSYVLNGELKKVCGDPEHGYTAGKLCVKGYAYTNRVYSSKRLKYPMKQIPRGSGNWVRITWDEALTTIADKILEVKKAYGTCLPICLNKYSGNMGILHYAVERFFGGLGVTTRAEGSPCWSAGLDAQTYDFGDFRNSDPSDMANSRFLILWGVNPAWTATHTMRYIFQAKQKGAKVVVIDPYFTATARKANEYVQIRPGTDGALALAMAKYIVEKELYNKVFLKEYVKGWETFFEYLKNEISLDWASLITGIDKEMIIQLAHDYAITSPANIWIGFGLQRHSNGGQAIRSIDALAALTGNIGIPGGGVQFAQNDAWRLFNYFRQTPNHNNRVININNFAQEILNLKTAPIKMLWVSCRNPLSQDPDTSLTEKAFSSIDFIVTVDHFLTRSAKKSDIVLPATTHFEEWDVVASYWHYWVAVNEPAIKPYYEAKSDLNIALALSAKLNELSPGSCEFPTSGNEEEFLEQEFTDDLYKLLLGISNWRDLCKEPRRLNLPTTAWASKQFDTPSGKFEIYSKSAKEQGLPAIPRYFPGELPNHEYPYWLISAHQQHGLNSQFQNLDWMLKSNNEPLVLVNPAPAKEKGLQEGDMIRIFNERGKFTAKVSVTGDVPKDVLVCYQAWFSINNRCINYLLSAKSTDMGSVTTGEPGNAFYDTFVDMSKIYK